MTLAIYDFTEWTSGPQAPDFSLWPSWPLRLAEFRTTDLLGACLLSIRRDAQKADDEATYWAAQAALDTGGDLSELDELFAQEAEAERRHAMARRYEVRTGREFPGECYFDLLNKGNRSFNREAR